MPYKKTNETAQKKEFSKSFYRNTLNKAFHVEKTVPGTGIPAMIGCNDLNSQNKIPVCQPKDLTIITDCGLLTGE